MDLGNDLVAQLLRLYALALDQPLGRAQTPANVPQRPDVRNEPRQAGAASSRELLILVRGDSPTERLAKTGAVVVDERTVLGVAVQAEHEPVKVRRVHPAKRLPIDLSSLQPGEHPTAEVADLLSLGIHPLLSAPMPVPVDLTPESDGRDAEARVRLDITAVLVPLHGDQAVAFQARFDQRRDRCDRERVSVDEYEQVGGILGGKADQLAEDVELRRVVPNRLFRRVEE